MPAHESGRDSLPCLCDPGETGFFNGAVWEACHLHGPDVRDPATGAVRQVEAAGVESADRTEAGRQRANAPAPATGNEVLMHTDRTAFERAETAIVGLERRVLDVLRSKDDWWRADEIRAVLTGSEPYCGSNLDEQRIADTCDQLVRFGLAGRSAAPWPPAAWIAEKPR